MKDLKVLILTIILSVAFPLTLGADADPAENNGGDPDSQYQMGLLFDTEGNHSESIKWFEMAARQGHAAARFRLGIFYAIGQGVERDPVKAHMWFSLAADDDYPQAAEFAADMEKNLSAEQLRQSTDLSQKFR